MSMSHHITCGGAVGMVAGSSSRGQPQPARTHHGEGYHPARVEAGPGQVQSLAGHGHPYDPCPCHCTPGGRGWLCPRPRGAAWLCRPQRTHPACCLDGPPPTTRLLDLCRPLACCCCACRCWPQPVPGLYALHHQHPCDAALLPASGRVLGDKQGGAAQCREEVPGITAQQGLQLHAQVSQDLQQQQQQQLLRLLLGHSVYPGVPG